MQNRLLIPLILVIAIVPALGRTGGDWSGIEPKVQEWVRNLMQPDNPMVSCCGLSDAYWADIYESEGDHYVAIITDDRPDEPLGRPHIPVGTRIPVPNPKIKWDTPNPSEHGWLFLQMGTHSVYCYAPPFQS